MKLRIFAIASTACLAALAAAILIPNASAGTYAAPVISNVAADAVTLKPASGWRFSNRDPIPSAMYSDATWCDVTGYAADGSEVAYGNAYEDFDSASQHRIEWSREDDPNTPGWNLIPVTRIAASCDHMVKVKRVRAWKNERRQRAGWNYSGYRGFCKNRETEDHESGLMIDCWSGNPGVTLTYRFSAPPRGARNVRRTIVGHRGFLDFDFAGGTISKSWSGNTATVTVTPLRAYEVDRVLITYQVRGWKNTPVFSHGTATWTGVS